MYYELEKVSPMRILLISNFYTNFGAFTIDLVALVAIEALISSFLAWILLFVCFTIF